MWDHSWKAVKHGSIVWQGGVRMSELRCPRWTGQPPTTLPRPWSLWSFSRGQNCFGPHAYGVRGLEESFHFASTIAATLLSIIIGTGYSQLKSIERQGLLREILDQLLHTLSEEVPEDSKFLLEIDFHQLTVTEGRTEGQGYWVAAMSRDYSATPSDRTVAASAETASTDDIAAERSGRATSPIIRLWRRWHGFLC